MYFIVILIVTLLLSCTTKIKLAYKYFLTPCPCDVPEIQSDFPQHFLRVNLNDYLSQLNSYKNFRIDTLQTIIYAGTEFPITRILFKGSEAKLRLLIFAGVHGNESGGVLSIPILMDSISTNPTRYMNWEVQVITPINPVGLQFMSRYNENGCDLNRKIKKSNQPGILLQKEVIREFKPDFLITLHESPSRGYFIFPGVHVQKDLIQRILEHLEKNGIELATVDYFGRKLKPPGISNTNKGYLNILKNIIRLQPLADYTDENKIPSLTPESGWQSEDLKQRVNSHVFLINAVIDNFGNRN